MGRDPGGSRTGRGIALGAVAVLAVLVTVFTLLRSQPAAVASAKLPPVEMASSASSSAAARPPRRLRTPVWSRAASPSVRSW